MLPSIGGGLTAQQVLDYARRIADSGADVGINMCQRFVRMAFGSNGGAPTALAAWEAARYKHRKGTPPPGAAVFWGGGSAGHVAISAGNGMVYSTDVKEPGRVSLVDMDYITNVWGKPLLGWSEDNNGIRITKFNAKPVTEGKGSGEPTYEPQGGGVATGYSKKQLREKYGAFAAMYEDVPEIQKLVEQAIAQGWTDEEFDRRFQNSKWYRNHTEEERQWTVLENTQPEEAAQRVRQARADIVAQAKRLGVPVDPKRLGQIARASVVHGWTPQQTTNAIAAEFDYKKDQTFGGVAGQTLDEFRAMSAAYLVPLSNKSLDKWTTQVLRGEADPESFESYLKDQAKSLFPALTDAIDRGQTVDHYLNPYREMAAQTLEINPDDVDWFDPKWADIVFANDPKSGARGVRSLADAGRILRTDPRFGFDKTAGAADAAAQFADELANMFGRTA